MYEFAADQIERVHSEQTGTSSQPSADCEHGSCRQIARHRHRRPRSRCRKSCAEVIPEPHVAGVTYVERGLVQRGSEP